MIDKASLTEVVAKIKDTRRYANISEDTVWRTVQWAAERHKRPKEILKAAKRKLYQAHAAYLKESSVKKMADLVIALPAGPSFDVLCPTAERILELHASTSERVPILREAFTGIFAITGRPRSILDIACGLNPFAIPLIEIQRDTAYYAFDIDKRIVNIINSFFDKIGRPKTAVCRDVLSSPPDSRVHVALLLKTLPCLEQQEKGSSFRLLERLNADYAVVSFPTKSLGGKQKGMIQNYSNFMTDVLESLDASSETMCFSTELFFVIRLGCR